MTELRLDTYFGVSLTTLKKVGTSFGNLTTLHFRLALRKSERHNVALFEILATYGQVRHLALDVYESKFTKKVAKTFKGFKNLETIDFSAHAGTFHPLDSLVTLSESLSPNMTKCSFDLLDIFYVSRTDRRKHRATKETLRPVLDNIKAVWTKRREMKCVVEKAEFNTRHEHHCTVEFEK